MGVCESDNRRIRKRGNKDLSITSNSSNIEYTDNNTNSTIPEMICINNQKNNNEIIKDNNPNVCENNNNKDNIINVALKLHNKFRSDCKLNSLNLNLDLCELAQRYAEKCADTESLDHCPFLYNGDILGENVEESNNEEDIAKICEKWFVEEWHSKSNVNNNYNGEYKNEIKHVSQILNNNIKEVGFGLAKSQNKKSYFVAYYYPAGIIF